MKSQRLVTGVLATVACIGFAQSAYAAKALFRGVAVITARTNIAACVQEYDVFESFIALYRANIGAEATPETAMGIGPDGGILITSNDGTLTLRGAGTARLDGATYAQAFSRASTPVNLTILPNPITATTTSVTITGTLANFGITGCNITIRAALTLLPPGGF